ncbi:hypothetical protein WN944_016204 [Citrus x changshan-huyou]|uniref:Uncharacterized protein n=1 Tax=Citrus x changshan-huyou TaxID=2935761 RepID=A0AAP0QK68_9ROSI
MKRGRFSQTKANVFVFYFLSSSILLFVLPTEHKLQKSLAHQFITKCRVLLKQKTMPFFLPNIFHFLRSWSSCHRQSQKFPLSFPSSIKLQPLASLIELQPQPFANRSPQSAPEIVIHNP